MGGNGHSDLESWDNEEWEPETTKDTAPTTGAESGVSRVSLQEQISSTSTRTERPDTKIPLPKQSDIIPQRFLVKFGHMISDAHACMQHSTGAKDQVVVFSSCRPGGCGALHHRSTVISLMFSGISLIVVF